MRPKPTKLEWRSSSHSGGTGNCVELAGAGTFVAIRDSKDLSVPPIALSAQQWRAFSSDVRAGRHDLTRHGASAT
jgi:hypothetical protein